MSDGDAMSAPSGEEPGCELRLPRPLALSDPAEVALEDYARALCGCRAAEAVRAGASAAVVAVLLRGLERPPSETAARDVLAFALELSLARESAGLGWS